MILFYDSIERINSKYQIVMSKIYLDNLPQMTDLFI